MCLSQNYCICSLVCFSALKYGQSSDKCCLGTIHFLVLSTTASENRPTFISVRIRWDNITLFTFRVVFSTKHSSPASNRKHKNIISNAKTLLTHALESMRLRNKSSSGAIRNGSGSRNQQALSDNIQARTSAMLKEREEAAGECRAQAVKADHVHSNAWPQLDQEC